MDMRTPLTFAMLLAGLCLCYVDAQAQQRRPYYEDLSRLRPVMKDESSPDTTRRREWVAAAHAVNKSVDAVLDSIDAFYLSHGTTNGFTIQVYSGQKKLEALDAARKVQVAVSELKPDVEFIQPKFRVVAGRYITRVEAQRHWYVLHRTFPDAIIIPVKFDLTK